MAIERTFSMLKPGVLSRRLVGEVISRIERKGLRIVAMKLMVISPELAEQHYAEHKGKSFYNELISYVTSGPVVAMVIEGESSISAVRRLCGPAKLTEAQAGTIRGDFALHTNLNVIHASDSPESAAREIGLFFKPEEIFEWKNASEDWI